MSDTTHSPSPLIVASLFIRLRHNETKHSYDAFKNSARVPADYRLWCTEPDCAAFSSARAGLQALTEIVPTTYKEISTALASALNVSVETLHSAAGHSTHWHHCPSAQIIVVWLAKLLVVRWTMQAHPDASMFGWVDAGFNAYRLRRIDPPPPPWNDFWPSPGSVAMARHSEACHNAQRRTNYSACPIATFLWGDSEGWARLIERYLGHARRLVLRAEAEAVALGSHQHRSNHALAHPFALCTEQDLLQDLSAATSLAGETPLFDEFQVSSTVNNSRGWGWEGVAPCPPIGSTDLRRCSFGQKQI